MTRAGVGCLLAAVALSGTPALISCSSCTAQDVPAFLVQVKDARTGQAICDAEVVAHDGAFTVKNVEGCLHYGPGERPGHYIAHVARDGYVPQDTQLLVLANSCHVNAQQVTVNLEPASP